MIRHPGLTQDWSLCVQAGTPNLTQSAFKTCSPPTVLLVPSQSCLKWGDTHFKSEGFSTANCEWLLPLSFQRNKFLRKILAHLGVYFRKILLLIKSFVILL